MHHHQRPESHSSDFVMMMKEKKVTILVIVCYAKLAKIYPLMSLDTLQYIRVWRRVCEGEGESEYFKERKENEEKLGRKKNWREDQYHCVRSTSWKEHVVRGYESGES